MARENIMEALGDIAREKGINREKLVGVIQEAITAAAKRKFRNFEDIETRINPRSGELEVFRYKRVVEDVTDLENEISLAEARSLDQLAEPGDEVEYEIDNKELSRVIAQTARQLIFQKIREAERETIVETFKDRVGEVLNGIVSRTERGRTFVTFNHTEAILYRREQIPHERYSSGDHIRVVLLDVLNDPREPSQLVISRGHPQLLVKLFEMEVPEIYDGIVEIVAAAREPGRRAKVAVRSHDSDVDPVGACVGLRGSRVQSIISELRGEKIDIIHYSEDLPTYVANALAPAELTRIKINEEEKEIDVEVEPDQLSLAIGRQGQNVRLASKLLGFRINIGSTAEAAPSLEEQIRQRLLETQGEVAAGMGETPSSARSALEALFGGGPEREAGQETPEGEEPEVRAVGPAVEPEPGEETAPAGEAAAAPEGAPGEEGAEAPAEPAAEPAAESAAEPPAEPAAEAPPEVSPEAAATEAPAGTSPGETLGGEAPGAEPAAEPAAEPPPEAGAVAPAGATPEPEEETAASEADTSEERVVEPQPAPEARREANMLWEGAPAHPEEERDPTEERVQPVPEAEAGEAAPDEATGGEERS